MASPAHMGFGRRVRRIALRVAAAFVLVLAFATARALMTGREELERGHHALRAQQLEAAIIAYRRAASAYVPLARHVTQALDTLSAVSRDASAHGDVVTALAAERAIHAAVMATRGLFVPHRARLERADQRIRELVAQARSTPSVQSIEVAPPPDPKLAFTLLALTGWLGWVLSALAFVSGGVDLEGRLTPRARPCVLAFVLAFAAFALGLANA